MTSPQLYPTLGPPETGIRVRPTRFGYTFLAVLVAMLLGAVNYNNNLAFLLTFLLGGMTLVGVFHTCRNIAGIRIQGIRADPVFLGDRAVFQIAVGAAGTAAAIQLSLAGRPSEMKDVMTGVQTLFTVRVGTRRRGLLRAGDATVWSRYPMGLFRAFKTVAVDARCVVYPSPVHGPMETVGNGTADGARGASLGSGADDFQGLRPYQPGESLQQVSWKVYSRGQGLFTKQFSGQTGTSQILNWHALTDPDAERRLSLLCGMVLVAHRGRAPYGLLLPGRTIASGRGTVHRDHCLKALALHGETE